MSMSGIALILAPRLVIERFFFFPVEKSNRSFFFLRRDECTIRNFLCVSLKIHFIQNLLRHFKHQSSLNPEKTENAIKKAPFFRLFSFSKMSGIEC